MRKMLATVVMTALLTCSVTTMKADSYNRAGVSYELETWVPKHGDNLGLNGFGVNYIHGFGVSNKLPIFIETGIKMMAGFGEYEYEEEEYEEEKDEYSTMNFSVPVNVAYKYSFSNGEMALTPYLGLNFKLNVLAKNKYDGETINLLKDSWGASVFQAGWHVGVGYNYRMFYIGLEFGTDFNKFASGVNSNNFSLGIGYNF